MANNLIMLKQQLVFVYIFMCMCVCVCVYGHICTPIYIRMCGHFKEFYVFVTVECTV